MPKAIDVAYVVYQVDDLDRMEAFMHDFGLVTADKRPDQLFPNTDEGRTQIRPMPKSGKLSLPTSSVSVAKVRVSAPRGGAPQDPPVRRPGR